MYPFEFNKVTFCCTSTTKSPTQKSLIHTIPIEGIVFLFVAARIHGAEEWVCSTMHHTYANQTERMHCGTGFELAVVSRC